MIERKVPAHIVNTASAAGLAGERSNILYGTSKFAVVGLSKALRPELEPVGIGVSALCPGPVNTSIIPNTHAFPGRPHIAMSPEDIKIREQSLAQLSARLAQGVAPNDVGRMVLAGVEANRL